MIAKKSLGAVLILMLFSCKNEKASQDLKNLAKNAVESETVKLEPTKPEETEVWEPKPVKIDPTGNKGAPSDAIVLFDGENLDSWTSSKNQDQPADWILNQDGSMTVKNGFGDIQTKQSFGNVQLHVEWRNPSVPRAKGQNRGNSGVFLQERYEVQVLDNYDNETYVNGQVASLYKQHIPLVNAAKSSGEWQTYDIIYHAPEFDNEGNKAKSGTLTVLHNGVLVQDHVEILGTTAYIGLPKNIAHGKAPIKLQDHNDNSGVSYRNIWVREL